MYDYTTHTLLSQLEKIADTTQEIKYDYGCSMLQIDEQTKRIIREYIHKNIDAKDVYYEEDDPSYGIETNSHITVVYGYTTEDIDAIANSFKPYTKDSVEFTLGKIGFFSHKQYYVLYIEVISNGDIMTLHDTSATSGLEIFDTYPNYHPHVTLAYMKTNTFRDYQHLIGDDYFDGLECTGTQLKITTTDGNVGIYAIGKEVDMNGSEKYEESK